jgi:hypothetical protein
MNDVNVCQSNNNTHTGMRHCDTPYNSNNNQTFHWRSCTSILRDCMTLSRVLCGGGLGMVIAVGLASLRTPLSAQLSANYRDDTEAAFAASEMFSNVAAAAGFLFANSMTLDMQLDLSWILCTLGFAGAPRGLAQAFAH